MIKGWKECSTDYWERVKQPLDGSLVMMIYKGQEELDPEPGKFFGLISDHNNDICETDYYDKFEDCVTYLEEWLFKKIETEYEELKKKRDDNVLRNNNDI